MACTMESAGPSRASSARTSKEPQSPGASSNPLLSDKAAKQFRAYDLDNKNYLHRKDVEAALADMAAMHGLPAKCAQEALAQDSDKRDKRYTLHDFLSLNERLHSQKSKEARVGRVNLITISRQPPPGADSNLALRQCFSKYCHMALGTSRHTGTDSAMTMNAAQLNKLCLDIGIVGERAGLLPQATVDVVFASCKSPCSRRLNYEQWLSVLSVLSEETGYDLFEIISSSEINFSPRAAYPSAERTSPSSAAHFQRFSSSFMPRISETPGGAQKLRPCTAAPSGTPLKPSRGCSSTRPGTMRLSQSVAGPLSKETKDSDDSWVRKLSQRVLHIESHLGISTPGDMISIPTTSSFNAAPGALSSDQMAEVIERVMAEVKHTVAQQASELAHEAAVQAIRGLGIGSGGASQSSADGKRVEVLESAQTETSNLIRKLQQNMKTLDSSRSSQVSSIESQLQLLQESSESSISKISSGLKALEEQVAALQERASKESTAQLSAAVSAVVGGSGDAAAMAADTKALMTSLESKLAEINSQLSVQSRALAAVNEQAGALGEAQARVAEQLSKQGMQCTTAGSDIQEMSSRMTELSDWIQRVETASNLAKAQAEAAAKETAQVKKVASDKVTVSQNFADEQRAIVQDYKATGDVWFSNLDEKLGALQAAVHSQEQQMIALKGNFSSDSVTLAALEDLVNTTVTEVRTTNTRVQASMSQAKAEIKAVKNKTEELEAAIAQLKASKSEGSSTASKGSAAEIQGIRDQIQQVEAKQKEEVAKVASVQKDVKACLESQKQLSTSLDSLKSSAENKSASSGALQELDNAIQQLTSVVKQMSFEAEDVQKKVDLCAKASEVKDIASRVATVETELVQMNEALKKAGPQPIAALDAASNAGPRDVKFASWDALKHTEQTLSKTCVQIRDDVDKLDQKVTEVLDRVAGIEETTIESLDLKDKIIMRVVRQLDELEAAVEHLADMQADD